ncbi:MAG: putative signal transducing protein, partial [Dehalococcoidia bacterium]
MSEAMAKRERLVDVYQASGELEGQVIKGLLESNGIRCILRSNAAFSVHAFTVDGMGEVTIAVLESMAEEARKIIG